MKWNWERGDKLKSRCFSKIVDDGDIFHFDWHRMNRRHNNNNGQSIKCILPLCKSYTQIDGFHYPYSETSSSDQLAKQCIRDNGGAQATLCPLCPLVLYVNAPPHKRSRSKDIGNLTAIKSCCKEQKSWWWRAVKLILYCGNGLTIDNKF